MASSESSSTSKQKSDRSSGSAGKKYLANALYLVTILFVLGFIWQSIGSFILP